MGNLIIGFLIGIALTYIILDQQISHQSRLIEMLNEYNGRYQGAEHVEGAKVLREG